MRRHGFATMTAVILLAVLAAAITAGTAVLASQWRRAQAMQTEVQLQQYLVAGEVFARAALEADRAEWESALPGGGVLRVRRTGAVGQVLVTVEHAGRQASQALTYERDAAAAWVLRDAELLPTRAAERL